MKNLLKIFICIHLVFALLLKNTYAISINSIFNIVNTELGGEEFMQNFCWIPIQYSPFAMRRIPLEAQIDSIEKIIDLSLKKHLNNSNEIFTIITLPEFAFSPLSYIKKNPKMNGSDANFLNKEERDLCVSFFLKKSRLKPNVLFVIPLQSSLQSYKNNNNPIEAVNAIYLFKDGEYTISSYKLYGEEAKDLTFYDKNMNNLYYMEKDKIRGWMNKKLPSIFNDFNIITEICYDHGKGVAKNSWKHENDKITIHLVSSATINTQHHNIIQGENNFFLHTDSIELPFASTGIYGEEEQYNQFHPISKFDLYLYKKTKEGVGPNMFLGSTLKNTLDYIFYTTYKINFFIFKTSRNTLNNKEYKKKANKEYWIKNIILYLKNNKIIERFGNVNMIKILKQFEFSLQYERKINKIDFYIFKKICCAA